MPACRSSSPARGGLGEPGRAGPEDRCRRANRGARRIKNPRGPPRTAGAGAPREGEGPPVLHVGTTGLWRTNGPGRGMPGPHSHADYVKELEPTGREKNYFFREDHESPIPHAVRHEFKGLAYFPPAPKYR